MLTTRAPAKVNLTLHIRGRRADGRHELESLVAFAGAADTLTLVPGTALSLTLGGATAEAAGDGDGNLVLQAARLLRDRIAGLTTGAFHLVKRLPVAAGIGGGSSDAAAALRLLARLNDLSPDDPRLLDAARGTGSDVPVCLDGHARIMRGAGEALGPPLIVPALFAVLVNPGVPVATAEVFGRIGLKVGETSRGPGHPAIKDGMERNRLLAALSQARNDLEPAAIRTAPVIADALSILRGREGCRLARMSGSGATVFGLFDDCRAAARARRAIAANAPGWWVKATVLR